MVTDLSIRAPKGLLTRLVAIKNNARRRAWRHQVNIIPVDEVPAEGVAARNIKDDRGRDWALARRGQPGRVYLRMRVEGHTLEEIVQHFGLGHRQIEINTPEVIAECDDLIGRWL